MLDRFGRNIHYMRLSITSRCNLRCHYCMPEGSDWKGGEDALTYEEFLQVAAVAAELGITRFKVTGGEPLARPGCVEFIARLKALPGVEQVTLTTNGVLLAPHLPQLVKAGIDGVNVSLDAANREDYAAITGFDALPKVLENLNGLLDAVIRTKLNCVLLPGCQERLIPLARFAERGIDVRFIEVMPIGAGAAVRGPDRDEALALLRREWPDLHETGERRGNGPAHYYASAALTGRIGMIDAVSHKFCAGCNRVRLTSTGFLKPCLCYGEGTDLRPFLQQPDRLKAALSAAIAQKPEAHCFEDTGHITEHQGMNRIGG